MNTIPRLLLDEHGHTALSNTMTVVFWVLLFIPILLTIIILSEPQILGENILGFGLASKAFTNFQIIYGETYTTEVGNTYHIPSMKNLDKLRGGGETYTTIKTIPVERPNHVILVGITPVISDRNISHVTYTVVSRR